MAVRTTRTGPGETRLGSKYSQGIFYVKSAGKAGKGTVFGGEAVAADGTRTAVYLWPSSDGKWRTGTTFPTNTEVGTVVGTQL